MATRRKERPQPAVVIAIAAMVAVLALSGYEYGLIASLQKENVDLRSQITQFDESQPSTGPDVVPDAFNSHLSHLDSRNLDATTNDYDSSATMHWFGETQGFGGTYVGVNSINFTYKTFLGEMSNLTYSIQSENATLFSNQTASLSANLLFAGQSHILGRFNGTVSAKYSYVDGSGSWLISREDSNFTSFDTQFSFGP